MPPSCWKYVHCVISMPSHQTSQPRPQAPSVGLLPVVLDEPYVVRSRSIPIAASDSK